MGIVRIVSNDDKELELLIRKRLMSYNSEYIGDYIDNLNYKKVNKNFFAILDDRIVGGIIGHIEFDWYKIMRLYIDEEYRGQHIGTQLLKEIEKYAKENDCVGIKLGTWDFQAREFYEKNGFQLYGQLDNFPRDRTQYNMKKEI